MIPRQCAYFILLALVAACAGGTTMRVADDDATDDSPVALAPAPEPSTAPADSTTGEPSDPQLAPEQQPAAEPQGYAPYGSTTPINFRRLGQWTHTGIGEARRLVIRDANAWAEFWSELGVGDRPAVDFTRDLVVAVSAGQQPTGGHEIAVSQVSPNDGELTIEVVETRPGPNCATTSALTQPVDVVVVSGVNSRSWSFVERKEVKGCR